MGMGLVMKSKLIFFVAFFFSCNVNSVVLGYITGTDYLKLNKESQTSWVMGSIDGMLAQSIRSKSQNFELISFCIKKYEFEQLFAVFENDLKSEPESWHAPAAFTLKTSLEKFCANK